jgi:glycosyltransferase involved in cell wall biosynthesis
MKTPTLSICIPTYKRAHYLDECLNSIIIQLNRNQELQDEVEVVISDNASPDNTKEIAEKYRAQFTHFTYTKNETNVGFDMNVYNVVKHAKGKYCWYLGDDDVIVNGAIDFIYNNLKDDAYDIVTVGSEHMSAHNDYKPFREFSFEEAEVVEDYNQFYFKNYCEGAFSVLIFNREKWMSYVDPKHFLTYWLYYEVVAQVLKNTDRKMLRVHESVILTGQDCAWSHDGTELFTYMNSNSLMEIMIRIGFDKEKLERLLNQNHKRIVIILLRAKGHGLKCNLTNLKKIYTNMNRAGFLNLAAATLVYFIPNKLIILARDLNKRRTK